MAASATALDCVQTADSQLEGPQSFVILVSSPARPDLVLGPGGVHAAVPVLVAEAAGVHVVDVMTIPLFRGSE